MDYRELKDKLTEEHNEFSKKYLVIAFDRDTFEAELNKKGFNEADMVNVFSGVYINKKDIPMYNDLVKRHDKEYNEFILSNPGNLTDAITIEASNHELEISLDLSYDDLLTDILGLTEDEIADNRETIEDAISQYKKDFYENN